MKMKSAQLYQPRHERRMVKIGPLKMSGKSHIIHFVISQFQQYCGNAMQKEGKRDDSVYPTSAFPIFFWR